MKVYTCFFFLFGGFCGYRNITEVVIVIVIVIIIFTLPLPQNTGNNKSQKLKKTFVLIALQMGCSELAVKRAWYPFGVVPAHLLFLLVILLFNLWFMRQSKNF